MPGKLKILLIQLCLSFSISAQLQIKNFYSITGKKENPVNVMCQDNQGYLLLGTNSGVFKFDGINASEILPDNASLKQTITALYCQANGKIWIGTNTGKVYTVVKNKLDSLNLDKSSGHERITTLYQSDSVFFIGTYGNGLYIKTTTKLLHVTSENGLSDNVVYKITGNGKQTVWCGTDGGITQIEFPDNNFKFSTISDKNGLPDNIVKDLSYLGRQLLVTMLDSGICYYSPEKKQFYKHPLTSDWRDGSLVNSVQTAANRLIIGTEKNGLIEFDKTQKHIYDYPTYIQTTHINQLFVDNTGQIWLASKKGLSHFVDRRFHIINSVKGLQDDKILAVSVNNNNVVSVGTYKGISILSKGPGASMAMSTTYDFSKYTISCAALAPNGNTWYGSYGNGLIIINEQAGKSTVLNSQNSTLPNDNISNIYFAPNDVVYISTLGGGLIEALVTNKEDNPLKIIKTFTEKDGLGSSYVYSALTDNAQRLFVASDGGGLQYYENNQFFNLLPRFKRSSSTVFSLCKDKFNNIWAVTNADGIVKYNGKSLVTINLEKGLRDLQPQQIIAVDNILYAFNSKGVDKINCLNNEVFHYDLYDIDLEPNLNAVTYHNGKIYSGTNNGILVFRTNNVSLDSVKPTAVIKALQINYKPFPLDSITEYSYKQNNIAIAFDGVWLKAPDKLSFRYKLTGFDTDWLYANEGKLVNYNNLEPGEYTFIVESKNEEDVWSEPVQQHFIILTPVWKRGWFWIFALTMGFAGVYLFIRFRLRNLQRENLLLEQRVAERTSEIEEQSKIIEEKNKTLEQLSLVASKTDNGVLILDADGKPEYVNESFIVRNAFEQKDLETFYRSNIYQFSHSNEIGKLIKDAVENKKSVHYETRNKLASNNQDRWESSTLTPIFDEKGELRKMIVIDTDITEIKKQERIIIQKNKDITDSISYAKKIQHAILPRESVIKSKLPDSFVLYITKDIVSGDFYWFVNFENFSIIAAVDCTGHGVPGAFMSIIGYSLLNRIINEKKITNPSEILLELNNGVLDILHKKDSESNDGMDLAICKINHAVKTMEFAGAMRPLWIINEGELTEIKGDKIPIGTRQKERDEPIHYTTHTLTINEGDHFYIFTDGYCDQFGGADNRKYSTGRLKTFLLENQQLGFNQLEKKLREEHLKWKGTNFQVDDILLMGFTA